MFGSFRRHQHWIWVFVIIIIVPSFLDRLLPSQWSFRSAAPQLIHGKPVTIKDREVSETEFQGLMREVQLREFLRSGQKPSVEEALEQQALQRLLIVRLLEEYKIQPSKDAVAMFARDRFVGNNPFDAFEREVLARGPFTAKEFERMLEHEAGLYQLVSVAGSSGRLLEPKEVEQLFRKENEDFHTQLVLFSASNYFDKVTLTPAALAQYYTNHMADYRLAKRVALDYVSFPTSNYLTQATKEIGDMTNLTQRINELYLRRKPGEFNDTNGVELPEAAIKERIKQKGAEEHAYLLAARKANEFGNELYSQKVNSVEAFEKLAAAKSYEVKLTPLFDSRHGLEDTNFPPEMVQKAFEITALNPIVYTPIEDSLGLHGIFVVALKKTVESELQPYEKVQEEIAKDFKKFEGAELARQAGRAFQTNLTNGLAQKKDFAEICKEAKVQPIELPVFSPNTPTLTNIDSRINFNMLRQFGYGLEPGQASMYIDSGSDAGMIVYMKAKTPPTADRATKEFPEYLARIRLYRQDDAFRRWMGKEAERLRLRVAPKEEPQPKLAPMRK